MWREGDKERGGETQRERERLGERERDMIHLHNSTEESGGPVIPMTEDSIVTWTNQSQNPRRNLRGEGNLRDWYCRPPRQLIKPTKRCMMMTISWATNRQCLGLIQTTWLLMTM